MEEENNWTVSEKNKNGGKKRFLRQLIVFIVSILLIAIIAIVCIYTNKQSKEKENVNASENKVEIENKVENNTTTSAEKASIKDKVYSIEEKDFYFQDEEENEFSGIKVYEYDNTNSKYAKIYYVLNSYSTDPSYNYTIEAKTEDGESLLLNDRDNSISEREVMGGVTSFIKIDKEKVGSKIDITVKEMVEHSARSRTLERQGKVTIDLNKDLKEQEKVDFKNNTASYQLEDIKFETYKDDKINKDTYQSASSNCDRTSYSIGISTQYGNRIVSEEYIQFYTVNNINNLTLDDAFAIERKIEEKIGNYGLLDKYTVFASNGSGEITNEYNITFEDMKNLIEDKDISANGKKISARDISDGEGNLKLGTSSKVTINGITAIKYNYKTEPDTSYYMFIENGYIYYITAPNGERYEENVNLFLNSLTKK